MQILDKLKSLTDKHLGTDLGTLGDPEAFLEAPPTQARPLPELPALQGYASEVDRLAMKEYGKSRLATRELAWRCDNCNTINGVRTNTVQPRLTCRKCARKRSNPLTLKQEFEIRALMDVEGLEQREAEEKVNGS